MDDKRDIELEEALTDAAYYKTKFDSLKLIEDDEFQIFWAEFQSRMEGFKVGEVNIEKHELWIIDTGKIDDWIDEFRWRWWDMPKPDWVEEYLDFEGQACDEA